MTVKEKMKGGKVNGGGNKVAHEKPTTRLHRTSMFSLAERVSKKFKDVRLKKYL